ncbi:MAG TPA: PKD domain-containing protein, partial [Methanosarcina sp.]|nr:PKD domain-containing protein [Methanosarcina sp.]
ETQITTNKSNQFNPVIYGDRIVWSDERNGPDDTDIYMYDLLTSRETQITNSVLRQLGVAIYGDRILCMANHEYPDIENTDIYVYDLSKSGETRIVTNRSTYGSAIYDDRVVWADSRNGNADIYMYNLSTSKETQITTNGSDQIYPAIYGDRIVWQDRRNGNDDIYMYDISTSREIQITTSDSIQQIPVIYEDRIVWQDGRNGHDDIYMCIVSLKEESEPEPLVADFAANVTSGYAPLKVLFTDNSEGSPTSWLWDFGDGIHSKHSMNATHTFTKPGVYNISLTVANANGSNTIVKPGFITVKSLEVPVADFSANVTSGNAPLKILFTDNSTGSPSSWYWDFGDGIYSKHDMNATHTFTKPGRYNISLTVANAAGSSSVTRLGYITVTSPSSTVKPVADFYSPEADKVRDGINDQGIFENDVVSFYDNSTGSPTSWFWDFGDGNTSTQKNPTHAYGKIGGYTVNLTVKNANGSDTISKYGYVLMGIKDEPATTAYFSADVTSGKAPLTVTFVDDLDAQLPNYPIWREWDFGDGVVQNYMVDANDSATPYATHTYEKPGKYTVTLSMDNRGGRAIITKYNYVTVTAADTVPDVPVADFSANLTSGNAPLVVKFIDTGTGGTPSSWLWEFGDGIYSKHAMNATHTYTRAGTYNVTLTVKNDASSNTTKKTRYIAVQKV